MAEHWAGLWAASEPMPWVYTVRWVIRGSRLLLANRTAIIRSGSPPGVGIDTLSAKISTAISTAATTPRGFVCTDRTTGRPAIRERLLATK
jgi:hypothetical protein